jgi:hypothetical protein
LLAWRAWISKVVSSDQERKGCPEEQAPDHLVFGRAIAASGRKRAMMRVIEPQEFRLPNTARALAVNTCELATVAML